VAVLGAGASAGDTAALLHAAGAEVELVCRHGIRFTTRRPARARCGNACASPIGPGAGLEIVSQQRAAPGLPRPARTPAPARRGAPSGPAPGWFVREQVLGRLPVRTGWTLRGPGPKGEQLRLDFSAADGSRPSLRVDHVIAATGYRSDLERLSFIDPALRAQLRTVQRTPVLDRNFQSSVPGLYFAGAIAANSFGPLLRFAYGADFAARRLARVLG
jgi:hypothetical protein